MNTPQKKKTKGMTTVMRVILVNLTALQSFQMWTAVQKNRIHGCQMIETMTQKTQFPIRLVTHTHTHIIYFCKHTSEVSSAIHQVFHPHFHPHNRQHLLNHPFWLSHNLFVKFEFFLFVRCDHKKKM